MRHANQFWADICDTVVRKVTITPLKYQIYS